MDEQHQIDNTLGLSRLLSGSAIVMLGLFAMVVSEFLFLLAISHYLGGVGVGLVSYSTRIVSIVSMIVTLGIPSIVTTMQSSDGSENRRPLLAAALLCSLPLALVSATILFFTAPIIGSQTGASELSLLISFQCIVLPVSAIGVMAAGIVRGRLQFGRYAVSMALGPLMTLVIVIVCSGILTPLLAIQAVVISTVASSLIVLLLARPLVTGKVELRLVRELMVKGVPLMIVGFSGLLIDSAGVLILGLLSYDMALVGSFSNAFSISSYLRYAVEPISLALLPLVAREMAQCGTAKADSVLAASVRTIDVFFIPLAALVGITSTEVMLVLFPPEFAVAAPALSILALASPGVALYYVYSRVLIAQGRTMVLGALTALAAVVSVTTTSILSIPLGIMGAGIASAITFVIMGAASMVLTTRGCNRSTRFTLRDSAYYAVLLVCCFLSRYIVATWFPYVGNVGIIIVAFLVLLCTMALVKPLSGDELELLDGVLRTTLPARVVEPTRMILRRFGRKKANLSADAK